MVRAGNTKAAPRTNSKSDIEEKPALPGIPPSQWWGYKVPNVQNVVDLATTYGEMDSLARGFYTNGLSCGKLRQKINLAVKKSNIQRGQVIGIEGVLDPKCEDPNTLFADKDHPTFVVSSDIEIQDIPSSGRGVVAQTDIPAGTLILVERPMVGVLDIEYQNEPWGDSGGADGAALAGRIADAYVRNQEGLEEIFENHHPTLDNFKAEHEVVDSDDESDSDGEMPQVATKDLIQSYLDKQFKPTSLSEKERKRLRAVAKLNALGFYTNCEQLFHTRNFRGLTGTGLYAIASAFNHSCSPNLNRFSIGDITVFCVSDDVKKGDELCISYIELEFLCAERAIRAESLNRDFTCMCVKCASQPMSDKKEREGRTYMAVDCQMTAELSMIPPAERIEMIQNYREMAEPIEDSESDECGDSTMPGDIILLGKDAQELRTIIAQSYMHLKNWKEAVKSWRRSAAFSVHHCPKNDESIPCFAIQAALCALADGSKSDAQKYINIAYQSHGKAFGSEKLMPVRMAREVECSFVPDDVKSSFVQLLGNSLAAERPVVDWDFDNDEIPGEEDL